MWRSTVGYNVNQTKNGKDGDDDWETDPDFVNDVTEEEQRWGSKTVEGSGRTTAAINIQELRSNVEKDDAEYKKKALEGGPKSSYGYGGKFGVQADRMDKSALGHDYVAQVEKHASQTDAVRGFGGKYGVQADRQDKSALGWDHHEKLHKHASQKDYSSGFGGKYGVQKDRVDKAAVGWDHVEKTEKHESQKDYAKGFGGKYGVDKGKQDKSAVGWEYQEKTTKHSSQKDYAKGFGGKFGVQEDRQDKSALGWDAVTKVDAHPSQVDMKKGFGGKFGVEKDRQDKSAHSFSEIDQPEKSHEKPRTESVGSAKASSLRARFESMAVRDDEEVRKRAAEERAKRSERELKEWEHAKKDEEERQRKLSLREDSNDVEEPREHVPKRSSSVAVPTPLLQAATVKSASPEQSILSAPAQPPPEFEDKKPLEREPPVETAEPIFHQNVEPKFHKNVEPMFHQSVEPTFRQNVEPTFHQNVEPIFHQNVVEDSKEDELFRPPQQYTEPAYQTLEQVQEELGDEALEGSGVCAIALYDYQAADSDEISFDPIDVITNIEMIDEGWWRGECRGQVGLFPSNYVRLLNQ